MDTEDWFNTPGDRPLTLAGLRGHVVLIDFWTYTCINCIRTLPYLKAWDAAYRKDGLTIVGVEAPEFPFERSAANVANAIAEFGIRYPVVQDNEMGTWNAYDNEYWPADYLIDAQGDVRYATVGEGDYGQTETAIRALLAEAGASVGGMSHPTDVVVPSEQATPETYLGTNRAQGWINGPSPGVHDYGAADHPKLRLSDFAFSGTWKIGGQPAEAVANAGIEVEFQAKHVYLVMSSPGERPSAVQVLLNGRPIPAALAGTDVHDGIVTVRRQRLYSLVSLPRDEHGPPGAAPRARRDRVCVYVWVAARTYRICFPTTIRYGDVSKHGPGHLAREELRLSHRPSCVSTIDLEVDRVCTRTTTRAVLFCERRSLAC